MGDFLPHGTLLQGGTYRIDYALGRGSFGITYQAIHILLEKTIAIKEFYPRNHAFRNRVTGELIIPPDKQEGYKHGITLFLQEGRNLAQLNHPNVVRVENFFEERGTAYLVMEIITGNTLREELDAQPSKRLEPRKVKVLMNSLVDALTTIHQKGIYHLDIKPDNIMLTPEGRLVLVDFGASRQGLGTKTARAFTPDYAPPELIRGKPVGAESDLFEMGMMLYEMLTGKLPPSSLNRYPNDRWRPQGVDEPWLSMITAALQLKVENRPKSVEYWWRIALNFFEKQRQEIERQHHKTKAKARERVEHLRRQQVERPTRKQKVIQWHNPTNLKSLAISKLLISLLLVMIGFDSVDVFTSLIGLSKDFLDTFKYVIFFIEKTIFFVWIYRFHADLKNIFYDYPITPIGAVFRYLFPISFWGIWDTLSTFARRFKGESGNLTFFVQKMRLLTICLYIFISISLTSTLSDILKIYHQTTTEISSISTFLPFFCLLINSGKNVVDLLLLEIMMQAITKKVKLELWYDYKSIGRI
ncbi:serine/threonine protein kinase [Aetokthonos hydrillicola Thurmond2011]|jgi:serine/threonine protein kinase|uniref:Serine/threonine protein kinase n=2 Tax=Aetokthonos TaxID=1550243 RepID=A0AAP5M5X3_9CYAN|nr:serine/threonine protein kinase [Aetokthonos hydrillicola Thurmond2011]